MFFDHWLVLPLGADLHTDRPIFADEAGTAPTTVRRDIERYEHIVWLTEANRCRSLGYWLGRSWPDARK